MARRTRNSGRRTSSSPASTYPRYAISTIRRFMVSRRSSTSCAERPLRYISPKGTRHICPCSIDSGERVLCIGAVRIVAMLLTANRRGMIRARAANINHSNSAPGLESQPRKFAVPRLPRWLLPIARASDGAPSSASDCRAWEHRREPQRIVSPQLHPSAESSWSMTILISQTRWPCS